MKTATATHLRQHLFEFLDATAKGETIVITHRSKEVARLVPTSAGNWRKKMRQQLQITAKPSELIKPLVDDFKEYR